jgi:hypothetical protein
MDPAPIVPAVDLDAVFPGDVAHCEMHYVLHVCGLRDICHTLPNETDWI